MPTKSARTGGTAMNKVSAAQVVTPRRRRRVPLPAQIQEALGELVGRSEGGAAGAERRRRARRRARDDGARGRRGRRPEGQARSGPRRGPPRPRGRVDDARAAGGCAVSRPRMRTADGERELPVGTYEYFADRDPLTRAVMDRMLAGVSTRKFARSVSRSASDVERASSSATRSRRSRRVRRAHARPRWAS